MNDMGMRVLVLLMASTSLSSGAAQLLMQTSFEQGPDRWESAGQATVSAIARRPGTRSLMLQQQDNADAESYWLSPPVANEGKPLKLTFWAADNYRVLPDLSYSACLDLVTCDDAGKPLDSTLGMILLPWDDGRKEQLWGPKLESGLTWRYVERIIRPGATRFRLKYRWPKPMARGECYVTDFMLTEAAAEDLTREAAGGAAAPAAPLPYGLEIAPAPRDGLFLKGEPLRFDLALFPAGVSTSAPPAEGELVYAISDFQHFHIARGRIGLGDPRCAPQAAPAAKPGQVPILRRTLIVTDAGAQEPGREFFLEVTWERQGRVQAVDTVPYGVVAPRPIAEADITNGLFIAGSDKMGACWGVRYEYGGWRQQQPEAGGPFAFPAKLPAMPKLLWCPNLEQIRGRPDNHPWGSVPTMAPDWAIEPDPRTPSAKTFKIEPYVAYMLAFIRHNREAIGMVVPSGLEREVDARTIELHKKAYTAIKKEFPDLPVGFMAYGVPMNPSRALELFMREKLYEYADFINDDIYTPAVDWTAWKTMREELKKMGRPPIPLVSGEFARVGGSDQILKSRDMITSQLDAFAHGAIRIHYWNQVPSFPRPVLREAPEGDGFMFMQRVPRPHHGGHLILPTLLTFTYYNMIQDFETAAYQETLRPDAETVGYRFERPDCTVLALWLTQPLGHRVFAVKTDVPFLARDLFGRAEWITPFQGVALITADENPLTLVFERTAPGVAVQPVTGGMAPAALPRGARGEFAVEIPGVFGTEAKASVLGSVDGTWPVISARTVTVKPGQAAAVRVNATIAKERTVGAYPIAFRLTMGGQTAGVLRGELRVEELLAVAVEGAPFTARSKPAVRVNVRNLKSEPSEGVVVFEDRFFSGEPRARTHEQAFKAAPGQSATVEFPVAPSLMNLAAAYEARVQVRERGGLGIDKAEEVGFRACEKAGGPISIDGDLADWNLADRTVFPFERQFTEWGKRLTGPEDLSGVFYTAWDDDSLYFAAQVRDSVQINRHADVGIWTDDNIMLGLYPWGWKLGERVNSGYYREHLGVCNDGVARVFRVGSVPNGLTDSAGVRIAVRKTSEGYTYEWAYPRASVFPMEFKHGSRFRLSLMAWDRDDPNGKLGGIQFGGFNSSVDARPVKWREFVMTE